MQRKMKVTIVLITITLLCVGCRGESIQGQAAMEQTGVERQSAEEEQPVIGVQSTGEAEELIVESSLVQQIGMKGRTDEETRLMRKIWQDNEEEFQAFLTEDNEFINWIEFDVYDFTGDGQEEMIAMKCYVGNSPDGPLSLLSYNYVYDQTGEKLIEFAGSGSTEIICGWDGDGTFLLRDSNTYSGLNDADIYTEIRWENGVLEEKVQLMELDRRVTGCTGKEGYYIFSDFTKEEEEKLWRGGEGAQELTETKEYVWEDKRLEEYERLFDSSETTEFSDIGRIYYDDEDGFQWRQFDTTGNDFVKQIDLKGRTDEETKLIQKILEENKKEFQVFLIEESEVDELPIDMKWIELSGYDFTGDEQEEIIVSKCYGYLYNPISYNYVYDRDGKKLLEFVASGYTEIIRGWDGDGTFLLYDMNHYGANSSANIYTEIRWENGVLEECVRLMELDCRVGGYEGKEGYYIFSDFTKEEEEKLWYGGMGAQELTETKEYVWEDKMLEEYKRLFEISETATFSEIGSINYSEREYAGVDYRGKNNKQR